MLDKNCKRILDIYSKLDKKHSTNKLDIQQVMDLLYDVDSETFWLMMDWLIKDDYIEKIETNEETIYKVTYKGLKNKTFAKIKFKNFLFSSILIPITVSIITAIITILLKS